MPQRRFASKLPDTEGTGRVIEETHSTTLVHEVSSLSLDRDDEEITLLNNEGKEMKDSASEHNRRVLNWKKSPFAVGLTEISWKDELVGKPSSHVLPDETGCLCCSAHICPLLGAGRVGNMAVLKSSQEWIEESTEDEETGEIHIRRFTRPRLDVVLGPYWPMLCFVTYPLIVGVSGWTFWSGIQSGKIPVIIVFLWVVLTSGLLVSLSLTACRDPGILYRTKEQKEPSWRWSDQAYSYRPRNAWFDSDTAVVVEGFDHTCPWTGTAIGQKNMLSFQFFVCLVFLCMIMDIFIITGAFH